MKSVLKSLYQYSKNKKIKELIFKAFNEDYSIRESVARNSSVPISILEKLSNDKIYDIFENALETIKKQRIKNL